MSKDFHAETAFDGVVRFLRQFGRPERFTFDRDPRWVGSASGRDFPSAFVRFLLCLDVEPNICPPHHPQDNCYVERFHRAYSGECLAVLRPGSEEEVREVTDALPLPLQLRAAQSSALLQKPSAPCGLSDVADPACAPGTGGP